LVCGKAATNPLLKTNSLIVISNEVRNLIIKTFYRTRMIIFQIFDTKLKIWDYNLKKSIKNVIVITKLI